jgi:glycosyltransferase involved in cell wall biosynthesis
MKVLIVEEALKGLHGHWFQYVGDIYDGGREAGHEIEVAVHRDACPEIRQRFHCHPILNESVFGAEADGGGMRGLRRVFHRNFTLFRELHAHFRRGYRYDVVVATTPRVDHLYAHLLLNWLWGGKAFRQLVLIFVESVGSYSADFSAIRFGKKSLPLKWGMRLARLLPGAQRMTLATESEGLAKQFRVFCGVDFTLVPHVTQWIEPQEPTPPHSGDLVLGTYGFTRYDKGADVLQSALRKLPTGGKATGCRFVIQWTGDYRLPDGTLVTKDPDLESRSDVEYLGAFKDANDFPVWLARTDVMILPYRREFYYDKLSRVAIDAAEAGMPMVYPTGTWLESFVAEYGAGVAFIPENPDSLAEALTSIIRDFSRVKARAMERKDSARADFSARHFFNIISELPGLAD